MEKIQVITNGVLGSVSQADIDALAAEGQAGLSKLINGTGAGNDFLGWVKLPEETDAALLDDINATAARLRDLCEVVVAIGIGGSYLGAKAVIEALSNSFAAYAPSIPPKCCSPARISAKTILPSSPSSSKVRNSGSS